MSIQNKFWLKQPKQQYDIKYKLAGFETIAAACDEAKIRIHTLSQSEDEKCLQLAEKLKNCIKGSRCNSGACPVCRRNFRRSVSGEVLRNFSDLSKAFSTTLVFTELRVREQKLFSINPLAMMETLRAQLKASGLGNIIAIGGFENDFDVETQRWEPHVHLLTYGCSYDELDALRKYYPPVKQVRRPMLIQKIKHPEKQYSYCFKSYMARKEKYIGKYRICCRKYRLRPHSLHNLSLLYLDQFAPQELLFMQNMQTKNGKLVLINS